MTDRVAESNPEHQLFDSGLHHTLRTVGIREDGTVLCVVPKPLPVFRLVFINLFLAAFFGAAFWFAMNYSPMDQRGQAMIAAPAIGAMTCVGVTLMHLLIYRKENRLGPWLQINKATGQVSLPRDGVSFGPDQVVHLQYITGYTFEDYGDGGITKTQQSELNLITDLDGKRKRWPVMRALGTGSFGKVTKRILQSTDVPVVRYKQAFIGQRLKIKDMRTGEMI